MDAYPDPGVLAELPAKLSEYRECQMAQELKFSIMIASLNPPTAPRNGEDNDAIMN
jgi:hypothetical protein